jgi:hypothetical protein
MRKIAILAATLLALPALADHARSLRARLIGYQEVPAVSTAAEGDFQARVSQDGNSVEYTLAYTRLSSAVVQAHIHFAQSGVNGPIIVWLCGTTGTPGPAGTPTCPQDGNVSGTFTAANVLASPAAQQLAAGELAEFVAAMQAGVAYANVHTATSPGGEIRGQIWRWHR